MPATVSTLPITFELEALEGLGFDTDRILGLAEMSRASLADRNGRCEVDAVFRFWDAAIRVTGDPAIAMRVGAHIHHGALGSFEYLLRNSESLRHLLDRADRYMRLVDDLGGIELREDGGVASLRVYRRGGYAHSRSEMECLFSAFVSVLEKEWPGVRLLGVRFAGPCPTDPAAYVRYFGCAVRFEHEHNELRFPAALLDMPRPDADPRLGLVLEDHAQQLLSNLPDGDPFVQSARRELIDQLSRGAPSLVALARALHMSERTLRRRLGDHGTSYQALLEELREELAYHYVARTRDGFDAIAARLAFADASTFFRAFKRWTGTTPAQFRDRSRIASV
jgi:AraC-like DNA-binding protein